MAEKLLPCPLCGSTDVACFAEECGDDYDNEPVYRAVVGCCGCRDEGCDPSYDDEPCFGIEAYFRADHPLVRDCEDPWDIERVLERHMAERWNRRAERTCRMSTPIDGEYRCGECGHLNRETYRADKGWCAPEYCAHCGAQADGGGLMSAIEYTRCDAADCGRVTPDEPDGIFHEDGWARVTVWGGETYDLCPDCAKRALRAVGIGDGHDR